MGIEPTPAGVTARRLDLKSRGDTSPHSLPKDLVKCKKNYIMTRLQIQEVEFSKYYRKLPFVD